MSLTRTRTEDRQPVRVVRDGVAWNGWYVLHGREVEVFSAYGDDRQPVGRMEPERRAERVLADIVAKWRSGQASTQTRT